jgi:hypothetical protein
MPSCIDPSTRRARLRPTRVGPVGLRRLQAHLPRLRHGRGLGRGPWRQGGFNVFAANYTASQGSLAFRRLRTTGGKVAGAAFQAISGATRPLGQPLGADNTTLYLSFLIRPLGTLDAGLFNGFFGVTLAGGPANELFVGKPGGGAVGEYVLEHRRGFGQVASGVPVVVGETAFLVVRADFLPGKDVFRLYVNPVPGEPEPTSGAVKTDLDLGAVTRLGIYSTGAFAIDEIRLGATYAEVTPVLPFAGTPGAANCHGKTVSALATQYGGLENAASALGYPSLGALQDAITSHCSS